MFSWLIAVTLLAQAPAPVDAKRSQELWRHAATLYDTGQYAAAKPILERLIRLDRKQGAPWMLLGLCEFEARNYGLALQHLQRGDALGVPSSLDLLPVGRYHQALALILAEKFDPAMVLLDGLARKGDSKDEVVLAQGLAALRIPVLPASLQSTVGDERIEIIRRVGEAQYAIAQRRLKDARDGYTNLTSQSLTIPNLHASFAAFLVQSGEAKAAEAELRKEIELYPKSVEARLRLCALLQDEAPNEMLQLAAEAVELDPRSFKTHFHLGTLFYRVGNFKESVRELETARDLDPSSGIVRFALMRGYKGLGRKEDARREGEAFQRLRAAEEEFRTTGRLPISFLDSPGGR